MLLVYLYLPHFSLFTLTPGRTTPSQSVQVELFPPQTPHASSVLPLFCLPSHQKKTGSAAKKWKKKITNKINMKTVINYYRVFLILITRNNGLRYFCCVCTVHLFISLIKRQVINFLHSLSAYKFKCNSFSFLVFQFYPLNLYTNNKSLKHYLEKYYKHICMDKEKSRRDKLKLRQMKTRGRINSRD